MKKRKLRAGEVPAPLSDWIPQEDWLSTHDDVKADGHDDYEQFEMTAWQQHAPHFAMDASGELREDVGPRMGKRKHYNSSVGGASFSQCDVESNEEH